MRWNFLQIFQTFQRWFDLQQVHRPLPSLQQTGSQAVLLLNETQRVVDDGDLDGDGGCDGDNGGIDHDK